MHNLLEILIFTLRNFTNVPILRYLGICNVLHIWHIRAIPTYRVYRLYDNIDCTNQPHYHCVFHHTLAGDRETAGGGSEGDRLSEDGPKATPCPQEVTIIIIIIKHWYCIIIHSSCIIPSTVIFYSSVCMVTGHNVRGVDKYYNKFYY